MRDMRGFENFYLKETEQYSYYILPKMLINSPVFSGLSDRAKILYSAFLTRSSLSSKNEWIDEAGKVYIIFSREEIAKEMDISERYASTLTKELANFGLIEKKKRGLGKPDIIYVKNFNKPLEELNESDFNEKDELTQEELDVSLNVNNYSPLKGNKSSHQEVNNYSRLKMNSFSHQEVNNCSPHIKNIRQEYNNNIINTISSSINLDNDDEMSIKEKINYNYALSLYGNEIVDCVFENLKARGRLLTISKSDFIDICRAIAEYQMKITSMDAFVGKSVDNMLKAKDLAMKNKPVIRDNMFNNFEQHTYDFVELERQLLDN